MSYYGPPESYGRSHSHHGHNPSMMIVPSQGGMYPQPSSAYYGQPGYAPSVPMVMQPSTMQQPMMVQPAVMTMPSTSSRRHRHPHGSHYHLSLGQRIRRFFGFGYRGVRVKSDHASWGFFGRSRRQRYTDARTGMEVDRKGRPVIRV